MTHTREFQHILEKIAIGTEDTRFKRLKKSFSALVKEEEISQLFANLEREKSSLLVCISDIDS
jgi:hypothetical protein